MLTYFYRAGSVMLLGRPSNAVQPLLAVVIGSVVSGALVSDYRLYIMLGVLLLIHSATTMWNDVKDIVIDRRNHVSTVLTDRYVSPALVRRVIIGQIVVVFVGLVFLPPLAWLIIGLLSVLGWQYSSLPYRFSRRPLASMIVLALSYGFLPIMMGASLGGVSLPILALGVFLALSRVSLSLMKDYKDAVGDAASNKRTFLLVFGHRAVWRWSVACAAFGNIGVVWLVAGSIQPGTKVMYMVLVLALLLVTLALRLRLSKAMSYAGYNMLFHTCLTVQLCFDGVIALCLLAPFII